MAQVALSRVTKSYGEQRALHEVSLEFEDHVTTAVVGISGSGKSTLLQTINGLIRPESGEVRVLGQRIDYDRLPELRLRIGYAVQGTGLFPHITSEANITLLARLQRWPADRTNERARELMRLVGLSPDLARRYPHQLSGGQQQRVGLCRAMMLDPDLLLLDEPFGALDPVTRAEIHAEFQRLQSQTARTMILVTHDVREAVKLARRVVVLDRGGIVQHGSCAEVMDSPANEFVARFFRSQLES